MSSIKRVRGHMVEFRVTSAEANNADLRKLAGPKAPKGLIDCIDEWCRNRGRLGDRKPTHRLKRDWGSGSLKKGALVHVYRKRRVPPAWYCMDNLEYGEGVGFYYRKGYWAKRLMSFVDEKGNILEDQGTEATFDYDEDWGRHFLEPLRKGRGHV